LNILKFLSICLLSPIFLNSCQLHNQTISLGNPNSEIRWVYLCGLTNAFDSFTEKNTRKILDQIGKQLNISIIAIHPPKRSPIHQNMFCWPHHNKQDVQNTYSYVKQKMTGKPISGYIGFSNGGFFLLKLAELESIKKPLIVVGAGTHPKNTKCSNQIFLLIGKQDEAHYALGKKYYQNSQLDVTLIEYDGGHSIPKTVLEQLIKGIV